MYIPKDYWGEILKDNFSLKGVGWKDWPESYNLIIYKKYLRGFEKVITDLKDKYLFNLDSSIKLLEVGPGVGFYTKFFEKYNVKNYYGLDISLASVDNLINRYHNYNFLQLDISANDDFFNNNRHNFNFITVIDVLLHVIDENKFYNSIQNISKVLQPGGYLLIGDALTLHSDVTESCIFKYQHNIIRSVDVFKDLFAKEDVELIGIYHRENFLLNYNFDFNSKLSYRIFYLFFKILNSYLYIFRNSDFMGSLIGYPLSLLDSVITPLQKYSHNSKFLLFRKKPV